MPQLYAFGWGRRGCGRAPRPPAGCSRTRTPPCRAPHRRPPGRSKCRWTSPAHERRQQHPERTRLRRHAHLAAECRRCSVPAANRPAARANRRQIPSTASRGEVAEQPLGDDREPGLVSSPRGDAGDARRALRAQRVELHDAVAVATATPSARAPRACARPSPAGRPRCRRAPVALGEPPAARRQPGRDLDHLRHRRRARSRRSSSLSIARVTREQVALERRPAERAAAAIGSRIDSYISRPSSVSSSGARGRCAPTRTRCSARSG